MYRINSLYIYTHQIRAIAHVSPPDSNRRLLLASQRKHRDKFRREPASADTMKQFDKADPNSLLSQMQRRSSPVTKECRENSPNLTHSIKGLWGSWMNAGSDSVGHQKRVVYPGTWNQDLTLSRS